MFKMMDEAVLKSRLGDMPAFAAFDNTGKFIFTYRSFILTAHNKLLVGGLQREGIGGVALVALYQMPLAALAVNTASVLKGEGVLSVEDTLNATATQMGVLGLFTEAYKIGTGQMQNIGSPALIGGDRILRATGDTIGAVFAGQDAGKAAGSVANAIPILSAIPFAKAVQKTFTGE